MKRFFLFFLISFSAFSLFAEDKSAIAVLIDVSRSVSPEDFERAKAVTQGMMDSTRPPDTIAVYAFGNTMNRLDSDALNSLQATESYTLLYDAAYDAAQDLAKIPASRKGIVILSDGLDTKSVTILEDIVTFANTEGISMYGVGIGNANRKSMERMAKLTGGRFYSVGHPDLVGELQKAISEQKLVKPSQSVQSPSEVPATATPVQPASKPGVVLPPQPSQEQPVSPEEEKAFPLWAVGLILGAVVALGFIAFLVVRSTREVRICPSCGKKLESYQTICTQCSTLETKQSAASPRTIPPSDGTQELKVSEEGADDLIPLEWLEKKPVTEEMLSKTFVLMETPMLVVNKGKTAGQTYSLNRAFPISIGRSRVNEIRLDDISVSGQHCRIIPENGRHVLYDLGSTNGTFVNDSKVSKVALKEGDTIKVGETHFLYKIEQFRS